MTVRRSDAGPVASRLVRSRLLASGAGEPFPRLLSRGRLPDEEGRAMTESEWLNAIDPTMMLEFLGSRASDRKLRLFACACCWRIWDMLTDERCRRAVEVGERLAEGLAADGERAEAERGAKEARRQARGSISAPLFPRILVRSGSAWTIAFAMLDIQKLQWAAEFNREKQGGVDEATHQAHLIRDIFGNPFRRLPTIPSAVLEWNGATAQRLAQMAYDDRLLLSGSLDLDLLAVLADALEEAGCTDAELLAHLRGPGPHVRGCWALDVVLGKG
jgi:hypothetical protein